MSFLTLKKIVACLLALLSVLICTPFTPDMVSKFIAGSEYCDALPEEKADMLLDLYVNQEYIFLDDDATAFTRDVLSELLIEVISSTGNGKNIVAAINRLPVYKRGEVDTSREDFVPIDTKYGDINMTVRKLIEASQLPDDIKYGFLNCTGGINDVRIYFLTTEYDGVYEFAGDFVQNDGNVLVGNTGVYYDSDTTMIYGVNKAGIFNIGFDLRAEDMTLSNPVNAWQRRYGYNILYDVAGNLSIIDANTVRVRFNYGGQNKMIQFWKGKYSKISTGAEIGIYNQKENCKFLYDCAPDEQMLYMSMSLYRGDEQILQRPRQKHWWMAGYQPGEAFEPYELTLDCTIEFTDTAMLDAFMASAVKAFPKGSTIETNGLTVHIIW